MEVAGVRDRGRIDTGIGHFVEGLCCLEISLAAGRIGKIGGHRNIKVLDEMPSKTCNVRSSDSEIVG